MTARIGKIVTGDQHTGDVSLSCDVCIVGSGSAGSWLAHELVGKGLHVVMLEEGGYHTRSEFDMKESTAYPKLYQELGNRTMDDLSMSLLQGRSVGGGTTVNWCTSFRTPQRILDLWRDRYGVEGLTTEALTPHWEHIEKRLHIAEWPLDRVNRNNRVLWDGLGKLGYERGLIKRNVHNCANLGYCGMGCPLDAKQSMLVTVIPDAVEKGLELYSNVSVRRIEHSGTKATGVVGDILNPKTDRPSGHTLKVKAKVVVSSGGAINSPGLLLRSGLDAKGKVGTHTWLHPVVVMLAEFEEPVEPYAGAPQSVYSHQFTDRGPGKVGFFLEVPPVHPMLGAIVSAGAGPFVQTLLNRLPNLHAMIALTVDGLMPEETGATVRLRSDGYTRYHLSYDWKPQHFEAFKFACKEMARIQFAAGAKTVTSLHYEPVRLNSEADLGLLDAAPWEPLKMRIVTAHQMGGCWAGKSESNSVVNSQFKFHTLDNLFVVDGSVLPTALGVNPQETLFGLGRWAAQHVAAAV